MDLNSKDNQGVQAENAGEASVSYCFGYEKMLWVGNKYVYFVLFMQVKNGDATKVVLSTIDNESRNLQGWRTLVKKAADKISDSKYMLFKDASFNFVMDIKDILPNTSYCDNIGQIKYDEEYRDESLALANRVSSALTSFRAGDNLVDTLTSLTALFKEIGAVEINIV